MKITRSSAIQSLILAAVLSAGLCFVSPVTAQQHSYIVDLNSKNVTTLGSLGTGDTIAQGINDAGQVVGTAYTPPGYVYGVETSAFVTGVAWISVAWERHQIEGLSEQKSALQEEVAQLQMQTAQLQTQADELAKKGARIRLSQCGAGNRLCIEAASNQGPAEGQAKWQAPWNNPKTGQGFVIPRGY